MNNFDAMAQQVWAAKSVDAKRVILNEMVDKFQHPKKAEKFRYEIEKAGPTRLDFLASSLALNDTDKVIK